MATLDFRELDKNPPGESFEALVRMLGERVGMVVQWSGRGADGGRDLFFFETERGSLGSRAIKWLVACKDKSTSGASVSEHEIGSVTDKVTQHSCGGFLLATTTIASSSLKEKLDRLDVAGGGGIQTKVWDRFELTKLLLEERCSDLLTQFFPKFVGERRQLTIDAAREIVENSLPRFVAGAVRIRLVSYQDRLLQISGKEVWPNDADQAEIIDEIKSNLKVGRRIKAAAESASKLHFDAFTAFVDRLIRNFPHEASLLLKEVAQTSFDTGVLFNVLEALREDFAFSFDVEWRSRNGSTQTHSTTSTQTLPRMCWKSAECGITVYHLKSCNTMTPSNWSRLRSMT
jgi:hypothetical protein